MTTHTLKKHVATLPSGPGIYRFKDARKKDLYIGKATNLKSRVGSYLKSKDSRIAKMVESASSLKFISTESEIEALILESQLIKQFRPPFNIMLRDDKQYFYVAFTGEIFPKIFLTHQPLDTKYGILNTKFIGPFTDGNILKSTLKFLRRIFPYCTCKNTHNNFCLNYHIGKCPGFCCLKKQNPENQGSTLKKFQGRTFNSYQNNIRSIKDILNGKKVSLIKKLEKEMATETKKMRELVPILFSTKSELQNRGSSISEKIKNFDEIGKKAIELRKKLSDLKRVFENAMIIKNSDILKTHRSGLESLLKLQKPIIRIEGYDVSNIQGTHATGSMVTFIQGQPDKSQYRKFRIRNSNIEILNKPKIINSKLKTVSDLGFSASDFHSGGDTAMLKEVLERRFKHEEWPFPDLVLIDGGKGQVNMAVKTLKEMAIKIQIIGISKNEHHMGHQLIIHGRKSPLPLTKLSPADRNLLLTIDSEAHRFAIGYYRKLHRKLYR